MPQKTIDGTDAHMSYWMKAVDHAMKHGVFSHNTARKLKKEYMEDYKRENNGGK